MSGQVAPEISSAIRLLAEKAALEPEGSADGQIARATGALPVHADMGGALVLTVSGTVLSYDFETALTTETSEWWTTVAILKAARRFPGLRSLAAASAPLDAIKCPACGGSGQLQRMDCGICLTTGWVPSIEQSKSDMDSM
jgi:hypothetical protein